MLFTSAPIAAPVRPQLSSRMVTRSPIFYGWIIVAAGALGMIMTSPGQTYGVSIFIEHFIADLGISRSVVSTLYTFGTLIGSFALPVIGRQVDARGPRVMVATISLLFGIACIYMGAVANAAMLLVGFVAIRMLGQGSLGLVSQYTINQWWVRRRGSVMGISNLVVSLLGLGTFPALINWLVTAYGWRTAYPILGILLLVVMMPVGYLLFRSEPERFGLLPDGAKPSKRADPTDRADPQTELEAEDEESWTLEEAIRTPAFWIVSLGLASVAMMTTGLMFHLVSIFRDNGLGDTIAAQAFAPLAVTTALITLGGGILVDRIPPRFVLAAGLLCQVAALIMAYMLTGVGVALLFGVVMGATNGFTRSVSSVIWANYFGREHLGAISGSTTTILIAGSALGPMPLGIARDLLGSYDLALTILAAIPLLLAVAALFIHKPIKALA